MKRIAIFLIIAALAISFWGCATKHDNYQTPVNVYYRRTQLTYGSSDSVIAASPMETAGHENDLSFLLAQYLAGPEDAELDRAFPVGTTLVSYRLDGLTAKIVLSDHFADLSGIDLSVACACLSKTIMSLSGCREVIISAENVQLDNNNYITISSDSYLMQDLSGVTPTN